MENDLPALAEGLSDAAAEYAASLPGPEGPDGSDNADRNVEIYDRVVAQCDGIGVDLTTYAEIVAEAFSEGDVKYE